MKTNRAKRWILFTLLMTTLSYTIDSHAAARVYGSGEVHESGQGLNFDEESLIGTLREGMKQFSHGIHLHFSYEGKVLEELPSLVDKWIHKALEETGDPDGGDYLKYQMGGYEASFSYVQEGESFRYNIDIYPKYYLYLEQKLEAEAEIRRVMAELGIAALKTDHEKVRRIYDYICQNVSYDQIHRKSGHYVLRSTVYAAMIQKTCTCQGYSVLLQRMLREAGIDGRIMTGVGCSGNGEGLHSWNIVKLGGKYYLLDATWDAGAETYSWFLKGSRNFAGHTPDEAFAGVEFVHRYPISELDYMQDPVHVLETIEEDIEAEVEKGIGGVVMLEQELEQKLESQLERDFPKILVLEKEVEAEIRRHLERGIAGIQEIE